MDIRGHAESNGSGTGRASYHPCLPYRITPIRGAVKQTQSPGKAPRPFCICPAGTPMLSSSKIRTEGLERTSKHVKLSWPSCQAASSLRRRDAKP